MKDTEQEPQITGRLLQKSGRVTTWQAHCLFCGDKSEPFSHRSKAALALQNHLNHHLNEVFNA